MPTDPLLQQKLDSTAGTEPLHVLVVLKPQPVPVGTADLKTQRAMAAGVASAEIESAIHNAAAKSGQTAGTFTIFGHIGTARLHAPAGLISALAENPSIASISLVE